MQGTIPYGPQDVRFEERPDPKIVEPTDAILRFSAACVCGSDLWPYRGIAPVTQPTPMGHEYVGIVEEIGSEVKHIKPGQFVVGSFWASDNTCPICQAGYQSRCVDARPMGAEGAQAGWLRVPLADGTLVASPELPPVDLIWHRKINPGKVFDLTLPLEQVAEGYRAMDERRDQGAPAPIEQDRTTDSLDPSTKMTTKTINQQQRPLTGVNFSQPQNWEVSSKTEVRAYARTSVFGSPS